MLKAAESKYNDPYLRWVKLKVSGAEFGITNADRPTERLYTRSGRLCRYGDPSDWLGQGPSEGTTGYVFSVLAYAH